MVIHQGPRYFRSVNGPVDPQRLKDYQSRVTDWIGRQGVFFQIRCVRLARRSLTAALLNLLLTLGVVALVILALLFGAMKYYQTTGAYRGKLSARMSEALGASSLEEAGFERKGGFINFLTLAMEGSDDSFFYDGKVRGLKGGTNFLDGIVDEWAPETIVMERAEFTLKAGGTEEEMEKALAGIVRSFSGTGVQRIEIGDLSCEWGYSKLTFGGFYNSSFQASLVDGRWEVELSGGFFRQNWIGPFPIESADLVVDAKGIQVKSLVLVEGDGSLELSGTIGGPLEMPSFDLKGSFSHLPVEKMFVVRQDNVHRFIAGKISGELSVSGSTNRRIETKGRVALAKGDFVTVRDRWEILKAISQVFNKPIYHRIAFDRGSFDFSTGGLSCEIKNIDLFVANVARMKGEFSTRLPSQEEAAEALEITLTEGFSDSWTDTSSSQELEDDRMSIRRAAASDDKEFRLSVDLDAGDSLEQAIAEGAQEREGERLREEMARYRFSGELRLALPSSVLKKPVDLLSFYPPDEGKWSWLPLQLENATFTGLGNKAAAKLRKQSKGEMPKVEELDKPIILNPTRE